MIEKQKTVSIGNQKQRIGLKRLKNDLGRGGKYKYTIVDLDTNEKLEDPFTEKSRAESAFRQAAMDIERGMQAAQDDRGGSGLEQFGSSLFSNKEGEADTLELDDDYGGEDSILDFD